MQNIKKQKFNIGMVFWTFDLFHKWHEFYISEAKKQVNRLIVVIARDARVQKIKNLIPIDGEAKRQQKIQDFCKKCQQENDILVILGDENDILAPIIEYNPEILFFGYDQKVPEKILQEKFPNIVTTRITSLKPNIYKSSILREKMKN